MLSVAGLSSLSTDKQWLPRPHSFNSHIPGQSTLADTRMSQFWMLMELRVMVVVDTVPVKLSPPA